MFAVMNCFSFVCAKGGPEEGDEGPRMEHLAEGMVVAGRGIGQNVRQYSYKELNTATNNFSPSNKIGDGGFGSVFKGKLRDGSIAGVKVLSAESSQGEREFVAEIVAMSNARHDNLLRLLGFCVDGRFRALVYDFMENSSLTQTLLGKERGRGKLDWRARRDIIIGVASGLAYLHQEMSPHVVHRDIKASNILLDGDLTPKISDFGLAKLFPENATHISTRVAGTLGYLAPEYAVTGRLTRKSDVYSFGVLVLEVICGRSATDFKKRNNEPALVQKVWNLYRSGELQSLVDATLTGELPLKDVIRFMKVGLLCVQVTPSMRPPMARVVRILKKEIDIDDVQITEPGVIQDLTELKVRKASPAGSLNIRWSTSATSGSSSSQST